MYRSLQTEFALRVDCKRLMPRIITFDAFRSAQKGISEIRNAAGIYRAVLLKQIRTRGPTPIKFHSDQFTITHILIKFDSLTVRSPATISLNLYSCEDCEENLLAAPTRLSRIRF